MENKDISDIYTPTGGDVMDMKPPYVGSEHYGQPIEFNRTEAVEGSNPSSSI